MTTQEWTAIAAELREVYMDSRILTTKESMAVWFKHLCDLPGATVKAVVDKYIETDVTGYPPKIAQIRALVADAAYGIEETPKEAWSRVYGAICRMDWTNPAAVYRQLPDACREAVSMDELISWGQMDDSEVQTVIASKFMSSYRIISERRRANAAMSLSSRIALAAVNLPALEAQ